MPIDIESQSCGIVACYNIMANFLLQRHYFPRTLCYLRVVLWNPIEPPWKQLLYKYGVKEEEEENTPKLKETIVVIGNGNAGQNALRVLQE
jgi:hypothetical protein